MSSNLVNQAWTTELCARHPAKLVPAYGYHPWFCHAISLADETPPKREHYRTLLPAAPDDLVDRLPEPVTLSSLLRGLRARLEADGRAFVGEIGLDRVFRLPDTGVDAEPRLRYIAPHSMRPAERAATRYTDLKTPIAHQVAVCEAQLDVAVDLARPVSLHCVTAFGPLVALFDRLKRRHGPRWARCHVDMHSYGGSVETIQELHKSACGLTSVARLIADHPNVWFSFSTAINQRSPRLAQNMAAVRADRLLVESDSCGARDAGERVWAVARLLADARGWTMDALVDQLEGNWRAFANHLPP